MKPNPFKYSVLTVGVIAAMGIAGTANAAVPNGGNSTDSFDVVNRASATYLVEGNGTSQEAFSNPVTVTVSEQSSFTLVANSPDGTRLDDFNRDLTINPQAGESVDFLHILTNDGNVNDTFTINIDNIPTGGKDNFDYDAFTISYVRNGTTINIANGETIDLAPNESVEFTVTSTSNTQRVVGDQAFITVSASSAYLAAKNQSGSDDAYTASNTDNAIVTTPIYAITKRATTSLGNKTFDTNNPDAYIDYTIEVTNEGNENGTAVTIEDILPAGLIAIQRGDLNYTDPTTDSNVTPVVSDDGKTITVAGQNIIVGQTVTITFRAKNDPDNSIASSGDLIKNYAVVRDDTNDDGTFDLVDSSGDGNDNNTTENNYENPSKPDVGKDTNNGTVTTSSQQREFTISDAPNKEVALQSSGNNYTFIITNSGSDITEAAQPGQVVFTVTESLDDPNIFIDRVYADVDGDGTFSAGDIELTKTNGQYDLYQAQSVKDGLLPGENVTIGVEVSTNGSGSNDPDIGENNIGDRETITITVIPQNPVNDTAPPANVESAATTTMQGINLFKFQAVDNCSVAVTSITNWSSPDAATVASAQPGQCIFYKLEATNTFTSTNISSIVLSDTLDSKVTYRSDFTATPAATDQTSAPLVQGEFGTLTAGQTGTVKFSVSISTDSQTTTP